MPRAARKKSFDSVYHIVSKSISEVNLFKDDDDKLTYISKIKKYQEVYKFRVYAYCLMDTHAHMIIDANGADISSIMKSINFTYAQYFNRKNNRHGHLFQGRFFSNIIDDDKYLMVCSAYIHNNPTDIKQFENCPENYKFSSFSVYMKKNKDPYELVEDSFIKSLFGVNPFGVIQKYMKFVYACDNKEFKSSIEFENDKTLYISGRKILIRDFSCYNIIEFVSDKMNIPEKVIHVKGFKNIVNAKAMVVLLMRSLCNYTNVKICEVLGNITQARVSALSSLGVNLIMKNSFYLGMFEEFIKMYSIETNSN